MSHLAALCVFIVAEFSVDYPPKGKSYDNKPFKAMLEAGKKYAWCSCGFSKAQVINLFVLIVNLFKYSGLIY